MKVQIGNLTVIVDSMDELDELVRRYGSPPIGGSTTAPDNVCSRADIPKAVAPAGAQREPSPLEKRLDELRDVHGPVFVIIPKGAAAVGMTFKSTTPGRQGTVELLESAADLADADGKTDSRKWFAKLVEE